MGAGGDDGAGRLVWTEDVLLFCLGLVCRGSAPCRSAEGSHCGSPLQLGNEAQQLEWAKRESERVERERLKRLRQQEQEDLELAIALSKAEMSNA